MRAICIEVVIAAVDTNEVSCPRTGPEEPHSLMALEEGELAEDTEKKARKKT